MLVRKLEFEIYSAYNQFHLECESCPHEVEELWTDETVKQMIATGEKLVAVGTARYRVVPITLEFHNSEPVSKFEKYSRVNECTLEVASSNLVLWGCTDYYPDAPRIEIEPANYRVRVLYGNAEIVNDDDIGDDFYVLQLWKDIKVRGIEKLKP